MKMRVKLYGTLSQRFPDYRHLDGIEFEIPEGATVKYLLALPEISGSRGAVVAMEGRILKADDPRRMICLYLSEWICILKRTLKEGCIV